MNFDEIHETAKDHSLDGEAAVLMPDERNHPSVLYWDEETASWLFAAHVDGRWHYIADDTFPKGMELHFAWDDVEYASVEETQLHHSTHALDDARERGGAR